LAQKNLEIINFIDTGGGGLSLHNPPGNSPLNKSHLKTRYLSLECSEDCSVKLLQIESLTAFNENRLESNIQDLRKILYETFFSKLF